MSEFVVLGCVCFGFKLLPEKLFRKCGCLVAYGKWIFRKKILVYHKIKAFDPESIFSQNFTFKSFPETHKERKDSHAQTERERERERSWTQKVEIVAPSARSSTRDRRTHKQRVARTHEPTNGEPTSPRTANPRPTNGEPTIGLRTHELRVAPRWSHRQVALLLISLSFSLLASRTVSDLVIVILIFYFLSLISDFFVVVVVMWVVVFWWFSCCVVVGFV